MREQRQHRQGDVFLVPSEIPSDVRPGKLDNNRIVLAYGEVTGHAHAIEMVDAVSIHEKDCSGEWDGCHLHQSNDPRATTAHVHRFLRVDGEPVELKHEEHDAHVIAPGDYEARIQREYSPEEIRNVAD